MKIIYKKEKSVLEKIDEAIVNASAYNKEIEKIELCEKDWNTGFCVLVYNRVGVTGTGWQCLATAGISAEGKRTFR